MLSFQITIIIIIIVFLIILLSLINTYLKENKHNKTIFRPIIKYFNYDKQYDPVESYDRRKINDILEQPTIRPDRRSLGYPPMSKYNPLNPLEPYPTRGFPENFRLLGTLIRDNDIKKEELNYNDLYSINPNDNKEKVNDENNKKYDPIIDENKILKLYGRPKYYGNNNEYEYYTSLSTGNDMTKINIDETKKLFTNDKINIPELNGEFKVNLYKQEEMKYNPFLF